MNVHEFNPPSNISEVPENYKIFSSSDIFNLFEVDKPPHILISFNGGFSHTQIKSFSVFVDYLNHYQKNQPNNKIFFIQQKHNKFSFLALLEANKKFTVTL